MPVVSSRDKFRHYWVNPTQALTAQQLLKETSQKMPVASQKQMLKGLIDY